MVDFSYHINIIRKFLTDGLIRESNLQHIEILASYFPFGISNEFGFESLLKINGEADFFFKIDDKVDVDLLDKHESFSELVDRYPKWNGIYEILKQRQKENSQLNKLIEDIWFEFDLRQSKENFVPSCFIGFRENLSAETAIETINKIETEIHGSELSDSVKSNLHFAIEALSKNHYTRFIALMLSRKTEAVRLIVLNVKNYEELEVLLKELNCDANFADVQYIANRYSTVFDYFIVALDVGKEIYPTVGLEFYFKKHHQPPSERWNKLFELLIEDNFINQSQAQILKKYRGKSVDKSFIGKKYLRIINHIKFNILPGRVVPKIYYGAFIR